MNENNLTGQRAALYIRVSTEEQARHGLSLDEQEHELRQYAKEHGAIIMGIYKDEGTSARKNLKKRKELQRLLDDVRAGMVDVVLFIKLDRWFRNINDYYKVQEVLNRYGVRWIATMDERYNTNTASGESSFILNVFLSLAQLEADKTRERIAFVIAGKKRRKEYLGGLLPMGYKAEGKDKHHQKIIIDEKNAPMIHDIFTRYLFTQSVQQTTIYIKSKYGIHHTTNALRHMLRNDCYIGTFYDIPNYAPPLIDLGTWKQVQYLLAQKRRVDTPRKAVTPYYFTGLIFCPSCNYRLGGKIYRVAKKDGHKRIYKYYACPKNSQALSCDFHHVIRENVIESYLLENIVKQAKNYIISSMPPSGEVESEKRVAKIQESLRRLKKLYVQQLIDDSDFEKEMKEYNHQLQIAQSTQQKKYYKPSGVMKDLLNHGIPAIYNQLGAKERSMFWHAIIKEIHITHFEKGKHGRKEFAVIFL